MRKTALVGFLLAVAALANFNAVSRLLGVSGRAPDLGYGDELNCPEGIILGLLAVQFYRGDRRTSAYAVVMVILNTVAPILRPAGLAPPFAMLWLGIWIFFLAATRAQSSAWNMALMQTGEAARRF